VAGVRRGRNGINGGTAAAGGWVGADAASASIEGSGVERRPGKNRRIGRFFDTACFVIYGCVV
jgi:hypothetical protein